MQPAKGLLMVCALLMMQLFASRMYSQISPDHTIIPHPAAISFPVIQKVFDTRKLIKKCDVLFDPKVASSFDPFVVFNEEFRKWKPEGLRFTDNPKDADIVVFYDETLAVEGYILGIDENIWIQASSAAGVFYALQTLKQYLGIDRLRREEAESVSQILIQDAPAFPYRGMHLDVVRHFFEIDFVKKYIDLLAMHKMNTFHWHLTDDQGWRIEIKQYPKLQSIAAWRDGTLIGHATDIPEKFDTIRYGGYYTHEQIRDVVAYAAQRNVTIIPEIEMPGHALAVLSAYPEFACTPGPFKTAGSWGVFEDVMCPTDTTFAFLENVLDEVIELFPSKFIHIGGDECPKTRWKESEFCQSLMKEKGIKDEHELQSYFITRIEKYLNSKGRQIIGWDEILDGGLSPNATVMSWRGKEGAIAAASQNHFAVMSPGPPCYFDHYQYDPSHEPIAIGGRSTLKMVYDFKIIPEELPRDKHKFILGGQGNIWTEYIQTTDHIEYMAFPRLVALAERLWSGPEIYNWENFKKRWITHQERLDARGVNYAKHLAYPEYNTTISDGCINIQWRSELENQKVMLSNSPDQGNWEEVDFSHITQLCSDTTIYFKTKVSPVKSITFTPSKATQASMSFDVAPASRYPGRGGVQTLQDGLKGSKYYNGVDWCAWEGKTVSITIDFGKKTFVNKVIVGVLSSISSWIHPPTLIEVMGSDDDVTFTSLASFRPENVSSGRNDLTFDLPQSEVRQLVLKVVPVTEIRSGLPGAGHGAWTFIDEIGIY